MSLSHEQIARRGLLYIIIGLVLICYTFGLLQESITLILTLSAIALMAYGAYILKLHEKAKVLLGSFRKK